MLVKFSHAITGEEGEIVYESSSVPTRNDGDSCSDGSNDDVPTIRDIRPLIATYLRDQTFWPNQEQYIRLRLYAPQL